jgi:hypothetical protein
MKDHPGGGIHRRWMLVGIAAVLTAAAGQSLAAEYLHDDVFISGQEILSFTDAGTPVTVVLENFQLTAGERTISGRDAVLWIRTRMAGTVPQHDITVYVEGQGRIVEPEGATTDETLVVTLRTDGRIRTSRQVVQRDLKDFPLYPRAVAARRSAESPSELRSPASTPAVTVTAAPTEAEVSPPSKPAPPPPPPPAQTIDFHYDQLSSQEQEIGADRQVMRATVLRGHVRITTGDPDSMMFLELRSDSAVVFTRKLQPDEQAPGRRRMISGMGLSMGGEGNTIIEGVYLDGDVVITRGERTFRGPTAYYDLTTDRAIIPHAVFHSVQEQRNIPIYVRAKEARLLSTREVYFRHAKVSTSEFYNPSYHIGASEVYLMDRAPYDENGRRLGPPKWEAELRNTTFNVGSVPILYWPYEKADFSQEHTALRRASFGRQGHFGWGGETEWDLFRLLGLVRPEGFKGLLDLNVYERGELVGVNIKYDRPTYSGYWMAYGVHDRKAKDNFGTERDDIPAPTERGRLLLRHKQLLPQDWELQAELSYICDRNFMEAYFPTEFFSGKEQETLLYAKKQRDNWALTGLLQYRLNRFDTQTESWPEVAGYLIGQPLVADKLTYFGEARAGAKRWRPDNALDEEDSNVFARLDTRDEVDYPLHLGPLNLVSYATGRATYWGDSPDDNSQFRPYGQIGQRINTHFWRVFDDVSSRMWDLKGLKHIITPEATVFASTTGGIHPSDVYAMDPGIEEHLIRLGGGSAGVFQRLQTKRWADGNEQIVDWMRLNLTMGFFSHSGQDSTLTSGGDFFWYRPEYSLPRNFFNGEYDWQISDTTALLSDFNVDTDRGILAQSNLGLAVSRDPRVRYYAGWRYLKDLDSSLATFGVNYQISRKYSVSFFEQYDMKFKGGQNAATTLTLIRQFPRWYAGVTATYIKGQDTGDNIALMLVLWPEGIPEARMGNSAVSLLGSSNKN